jgi:predicted nucleic acid-binding protein
MIKRLLSFLDIISIDQKDCVNALDSLMPDFEDAIVMACAKKISAHYIVTRDEQFIKTAAEVEVISPEQLLAILK